MMMSRVVKRGFVPKDKIEFGVKYIEILNQAAQDLYYMVNRGYALKSASTFVGNHFMLSERQRLALYRTVTSKERLDIRKKKELSETNLAKQLYIDGFNTIITLEVALSGSLLIKGSDGCIRDLAGLRGNYRIVNKTVQAVSLMLQILDELGIEDIVIFLDQPVSNSGRLKALIYEISEDYHVGVNIEVIPDVDRNLKTLEGVITSDAIILDKCKSWFNLNSRIIKQYIPNSWILELEFIEM